MDGGVGGQNLFFFDWLVRDGPVLFFSPFSLSLSLSPFFLFLFSFLNIRRAAFEGDNVGNGRGLASHCAREVNLQLRGRIEAHLPYELVPHLCTIEKKKEKK